MRSKGLFLSPFKLFVCVWFKIDDLEPFLDVVSKLDSICLISSLTYL